MAITIRKLEVFLEVAAQASFVNAAEQLGISQPSVSTQIADLEQELGFPLFHRKSGARPQLTEQGHGFVPKAKEMVSAHSRLRAAEAEPSKQRTRLVVATGAMLFDLIREDLSALILEDGDVDLEFEVVTHLSSMLRSLDERLIDIAIHTGLPPRRTRYQVEIVCPVSYSVFARPDLAANYAAGAFQDEPLPLILPPKGGWATEPVRAMLAEAGVSLENVVARSHFPDVLFEMALDGVAAIVMPNDTVEGHVAAGRLLPVKSDIGKGYRYMLLGPKALSADAARVVARLKALILSKQQGLASPIEVDAAIDHRSATAL